MTLHDLEKLREDVEKYDKSEDFEEHEQKLWDSRNFYISGATFNYKYSHQLSVAISKMQGLTNSIRVSYFILFSPILCIDCACSIFRGLLKR